MENIYHVMTQIKKVRKLILIDGEYRTREKVKLSVVQRRDRIKI